jgi:hypothetical protein
VTAKSSSRAFAKAATRLPTLGFAKIVDQKVDAIAVWAHGSMPSSIESYDRAIETDIAQATEDSGYAHIRLSVGGPISAVSGTPLGGYNMQLGHTP